MQKLKEQFTQKWKISNPHVRQQNKDCCYVRHLKGLHKLRCEYICLTKCDVKSVCVGRWTVNAEVF